MFETQESVEIFPVEFGVTNWSTKTHTHTHNRLQLTDIKAARQL